LISLRVKLAKKQIAQARRFFVLGKSNLEIGIKQKSQQIWLGFFSVLIK